LSAVADPSMQPTQPMPRQRERTVRVVGVGLLGVVLVGGAAFFWTNRSVHPGTPATSAGVTASVPAANASPLADTSVPRGVASGSAAPVASHPAASVPVHPPPRVHKPDSLAATKGSHALASAAPKTPPPHADSSVHAVAAKTDSASVLVLALTRSLDPFLEAIRNEDLAGLSRADPTLPETEKAFYTQVFQQGEDMRPNLERPSTTDLEGNKAHMPVTLRLRYVIRSSKASMFIPPRRYDAYFEKRDGTWQLTELRLIP